MGTAVDPLAGVTDNTEGGGALTVSLPHPAIETRSSAARIPVLPILLVNILTTSSSAGGHGYVCSAGKRTDFLIDGVSLCGVALIYL